METIQDLKRKLRETIRVGKGTQRSEVARACKNLERELHRKIAKLNEKPKEG